MPFPMSIPRKSAAGGSTTSPGALAKRPRVFEDICDQIRQKLSNGELKQGDRLPSERDLAEAFGTSRAAVREALRSLERGGVVELRKGVKGGTYISRADPSSVTQSLHDLLSFGAVSIQSLTESRTILQDAVVRLACDRGSDADFDLLEAGIDRTELLTREGRLEERRVQLLEFYRLLGRATRNEVMVILVGALTDMVLKLMSRHNVAPRMATIRTHRQIVLCLRKRDKEGAAQLMSVHLNKLHAHFLKAERNQKKRERTVDVAATRSGA